MMAETTSHLDGAHYGPSSKFQIQENNKHRAKPTVQYELSPTGPIRTEILTHSANQKNAEIGDDAEHLVFVVLVVYHLG